MNFILYKNKSSFCALGDCAGRILPWDVPKGMLTLTVILRENVPDLNDQSHQQSTVKIMLTINFMIEIRMVNT